MSVFGVPKLENCHKGFGRYLDGAQLAHLLFALLLFFKKLLFTGYITAVALRKNVLAQGTYGFAGDNLCADGRLNRDFEELTRDIVLQSLGDFSGAGVGFFLVDYK